MDIKYGGFSDSSVSKEYPCNAGDSSSIPGFGRSTGEGTGFPLQYSWASLVALLVKNNLQCRRPGFDPWVGRIPWRRERLPTPVFWPGEFHGLYSLWVAKSRTRLNDLHFFTLHFQMVGEGRWLSRAEQGRMVPEIPWEEGSQL